MFFFSYLEFSFFRGFDSLKIPLPNDFILLYGDNGSGKTNFLEALNILCLTKSFKSVADKDLVQWNQEFYFLSAEVKNHHWLHHISCNYLKNKGKKIFHENQPIDKFSEHIGLLPCVSLVPEDSEIIKDAVKRKKWFNLLFSQWDNEYLQTLQKYENALQQRNALLKSEKPFKELEPWTYQLCVHGKVLVNKRKIYFHELSKIYAQIYDELTNWDVSNFFYQPNYEYSHLNYDMLFYENNLKNDYLYGFTTMGAHRDDVIFQINHQNLKHFGSQGQQKTFIITLKLSEYHFLSQNFKVPILLLDDVFEKLDKQRIRLIANYLYSHKKGQIFVTHPQFLELEFPSVNLQVKNHQIFPH
ncbi:MAG: DNA replication and repair protein RecF [Bacteroidia bacterium]|nr:MAG: DNA replication and repair protein RecF [Bacteroidia bacterium]